MKQILVLPYYVPGSMRNLLVVGHESVPWTDAAVIPPSATAWDTTTDSLICAFGPTEDFAEIELKRFRFGNAKDAVISAIEELSAWDAPCPQPDWPSDEILSLQWFADSSTACVVLAGGDLILFREDPLPDEDRIEIVGSVDVGIAAAAWSPDEELLCIVTRSDTLLFMTREFDHVGSASLSPDDVRASKHVNVGWGKKETQFQGKRAKALRDPTMPDSVDEGKLSAVDTKKTIVSWRGDGAYVAVNAVVLDTRRLVRVYTREGILDSASEPVDGLESALSWRPSGNLMASTQRKNDSIDVVFFERNGLRHGQFTLRLKPEDMQTWARDISLSWNTDSTILAVAFADRVQFWTMGNYHYYLKQEIFVGDRELAPAAIRWHPSDVKRVALLEAGHVTDLKFMSHVASGSTVQPNDYGMCGVVDGTALKLTPLKLSGVPPPMSLFDISINEPVVDAAFSVTGQYLAILTSCGVYVFGWSIRSRPVRGPQLVQRVNHDDIGSQSRLYRQIVGYGDDRFYVLWDDRESTSHVTLFQQSSQTAWSQEGDLKFTPGSVQYLVTDTHQDSLWVQHSGGVYAITPELENLELVSESGPNKMSQLAFVQKSGGATNSGSVNGYGVNTLDEHIKIGLGDNGELYADNRLLTKGCSSFLVTPLHLLFTTSNHLLKFVHITDPADMEIPADTPEIDERCRAIERGGKLVAVVPSNYAVTLQMPRGNLETIYPRALVLAGIRQHIDGKDYKSAYLACRNHQVDTNILCDYKAQQFLDNIPLVISQLKKPSRIDDFLAKLRDEDVTLTLYKDTLKGQLSNSKLSVTANGSKTNEICNSFLTALESDPSTKVQNIITAHVSKRPPDLLSGLRLVAQLRSTSIPEADAAIEHLCFLSDVNRLYDCALSLYDVPLTLLVAEQSQKDPREYMPFLERLHAIPHEARRRFEIDDHLRNYLKALTALYDLGAHDELERYCTRHELYTQALALYKYETQPQPRLKQISRLFAEYLVSHSRNRQAAIVYESLLDYASAYPLYALAHMWRESLACSAFVQLNDEQRKQHALSLATTLAEQDRDFRAAATIHTEHLGDHPAAARLLCRGSYFGDASRILALHGLQDQISGTIDPGLTEKFGEILELLADCKSQLAAQVLRIEELRVKKAEDPLTFFGGEANTDAAMAGDIPDNVSIAPTNASTTGGQSLFTRYGSSKGAGTVMSTSSRKTSRTRRKEERKRAMGKKGSVYEEEYLVASVGRCIARVNTALEEMRRLGEGLLRRGMRDRVEVLEENVKSVIELSRNSVSRIWMQDSKGDDSRQSFQIDSVGQIRPKGGEGVLWDSQQQAAQPFKDPPSVKEWKSIEA